MSLSLCTLVISSAAADGVRLDDLLEQVRTTHPLFAREARRADIERHSRDAATGAEDWAVRASGRYAYQNPVQTNPFVPEHEQNVVLDAGVERSFWGTGGRLGVGWSGSYLRQRYADAISFGPAGSLPELQELYESRLQVSYSQPLLKNLGGTIDRLPFELGTHAIEIAALSAAENQEAFLVQIGDRYLDWALAVEQARITAARLKLAEEQLAQAQRKRAANLVDRVEVLRNLDAVQTVKQALVLLEAQAKALRSDLAVFAQQPEILDSLPVFDLYAPLDLPSADDALAELLERSRLVRTTRAARAQAVLSLGAAAEASEPELSVAFGAGLLGYDDSLGRAFEMADPEANVMVMFRYPLGNTTAQAELERNRVLLAQIDDSLAETELQLESALRGLLVRLTELERVLEIDRAQIQAARDKASEELKLYNRGRGQLVFVIQAQDAVARAEANYADNAASAHKLWLQYRELADRLLGS